MSVVPVIITSPVKIQIRFWREPVQTKEGLPLQGNEVGDARIVLDEKALYVWDGSQWVKVTNIYFTDLLDTPSSYAGQAGKYLRVKDTEDGLEFATAIDTFLGLLDTPSSYSGYGKYLVRVKSTEDGLEFVDPKIINKPSVIVPDDFDDIQSAINWLRSNFGSGIVFLRPQEYTISSTIRLRQGIHIIGLMKAENEVGVVYPKLLAQVSPVFDVECWSVTTPFGRIDICGLQGCMFANFIVDGQGSYGIGFTGSISSCKFFNLLIQNFLQYGIDLGGANNVLEYVYFYGNATGLRCSGSMNILINIRSENNDYGIELAGGVNKLINPLVIANNVDGIVVASEGNTIVGGLSQSNNQAGGGGAGIVLAGNSNRIIGVDVSDEQDTPTQEYGIQEVSGVDENIIIGCRAKGNTVKNYEILGANSILLGCLDL